ncbi:LamG-like jellyroll fold domain-containing protein [Streptomyces sp. NPDC127038]|uniref:LamG-like jellyroll fold domain-containing protein n=1 Tax=Streptomyces sp. NPDC127038 TaxID=3347114 RepID=UPI00364CBFEF
MLLTAVAAVVLGTVPSLNAGPAAALSRPASKAPAKSAGSSSAGKAARSQSAALARARSTGENTEITALRNESEEVYATPDGKLESVQHLRPVRARVDGQWAKIDNTLVRGDGDRVTPKAAAVGLTFSGGGKGPLVKLERAGRTLAYEWPQVLPTPVLDGDTATYRDVLPDVDLQVRSDTDGFSELLVVRTAEAAKNPALTQLKLGFDTSGLTLRESAGGGLEARDASAGGVVFQAARPIMWDSGTTGAPAAAAMKSASAAGTDSPDPAPAGTADEGPGDAAKVAPIGVDVDAEAGELRLTPDAKLLSDPKARFPIYIDPQTYTPKAGEWTMVSKYWADSPQWRFNGDSDSGVGDCEWYYCAPYDTKRLFYKFPTSKFAGKTIISAQFVANESWSASCDGRSVELWRTKSFGSSTTWNSSKDNWLDKLDSRDVAKGFSSSCPGGTVEFDASAGVKYAAAHDDSYTSFGLRAGSETDPYGWKRFTDDAYLRVKYNRPPAQISMSQLAMDPGGSCKRPEKKAYVRSLPKAVASNVTDPDGDQVSVQFQAIWDTGDGKGMIARWTSAKSTPKKSGSNNFSVTLPSSVPKGKTVAWSVRAVDYDDGKYYSYSPWSSSGDATSCYFVYDTSVPAGPTITSGDYPASDPSDPNDPWYDGVGKYANFTFDVPNTDVTKYWFGINTDPTSENELITTGGGAQTMKFRPTRSGLNWVTAQAFDKAGNGSEIRTYQFRVSAGQPARGQWKLDEPAGATQAEGISGTRTLDLKGGPTLGAEGAVGTAASFDGVDDYLQSDIPAVDTSAGFSVSAWAKLSRMPSGAAIIAAQPGNHAPGFELYYSKTYDRWAFNQYSADTATATPVRVMQAAAGGVKANEWVHLVGTYTIAGDALTLYVNGVAVGTTAYSTPWDARRGLQIGAGSYDGAPGSFFPGAIDDVRLFDKPLSATEVGRLYDKQPLGAGRPALAAFPLDEPALQDNGSATTQVHGRGDVKPAVFKGGVTAGGVGADGKALTLDGVDDYATTGGPMLNNQRSFSVAAWAKLSTTKPTKAAVIATQIGTVRPGFELYYSPTYGWTFNNYSADTADGTPVRAAQGDPAMAPGGVWTQVVGSYDAVTDDLRLYVQGKWVATTKWSTPFYAGGAVQIGASVSGGAPVSFFPGQIDDVQLYDRALSAPEIADLYKARPLVKGRWKLDSATGTPAVSADDMPLAADRHALTLGGNATVDTSGNSTYVGTGGGLLLDGKGDYAATAVSPVHTNTSFTVGAWVTTAARPQEPVTVLSQAGANNSGFVVRYVPDAPPAGETDSISGHWQLAMAGADTTTAATVSAEHNNFQNNTPWNHIAVVYDAFSDQMRLYVDGEPRQTLCADDDDDGTANDPTCTEKVSWNSNVTSFDATKGLQLGRVKTGASTWGEYWPGAIDDVWVMEGVASDAQIAALANGSDLATSPGP